jgi:membrane associated rhomboid family serine protease
MAVITIANYLAENPPAQPKPIEIKPPTIRSYSTAYVILALALIHWVVQPGYEQRLFIAAYGADSGAILNGEVYRCVTALLFHSDWGHLLANAFGLAVFGTVAAMHSGWGMGWLMILATGAVGNLLNAAWYAGNHVSIGASTAVFGAVGLCSAMTFIARMRRSQRTWRDWLPIGAGMALLAFLGASPRTDLLAHLFGFGVGILIGGLYAWRRSYPLAPRYQWGAILVVVVVVMAAWGAGLPEV